jgi:hypothetical protein
MVRGNDGDRDLYLRMFRVMALHRAVEDRDALKNRDREAEIG